MGVWIEIVSRILFAIGQPTSPPLWGCGLKFWNNTATVFQMAVAPFVGVWIEIELKPGNSAKNNVAPFVGVWIEIISGKRYGLPHRVAPFVGVWIEILSI